MKYTKTILCLANSRKLSGRCVAGREILEGGKFGAWIRPVSEREHGEVSEEDRRFENGGDPRVLDVIRIPMREPKPQGYQIENHLIDAQFYWTLVRRAAPDDVRAALDAADKPLWNNASSSYHGRRDRVLEAQAGPDDGSLRLIAVKDLIVTVEVEGADIGRGKRKVRGQFTHAGSSHLFSITDPVVERRYLLGADGQYPVGNAILCISLGEAYQGFAYKLIAGVILG